MPDPLPWQVVKSEVLLDQPPWLRVIRQTVQLPGGAVIDDYLVTSGRDYAMVVALNEAGEVLLVRQYKHGLGRVVLEFPAGYLDSPGEEPLACAQRELREETGYEARSWTALGAFCLDPNRSPNLAHFFLARGLVCTAAPHLDSTESLTHLTVAAREVPDLLRMGAMSTLACAAAWGLAVGHGVGAE